MSADKTTNVADIIKAKEISLPVGIILEKCPSKHPWGDFTWKVTGVIAGAKPVEDWVLLHKNEDCEQYHMATLPLTLHRKETEAFKLNLEGGFPHLYVILREDEEGERPFTAHAVTASPYDAQDFLDTSEDRVEKLAMPQAIIEWIRFFVEEHHVEETFKKRKRDKLNVEEHKFGKEPIFASHLKH